MNALVLLAGLSLLISSSCADMVCSQFGYNMAAEIRCLRSLLTECQKSLGRSSSSSSPQSHLTSHVTPRSSSPRLHSATMFTQPGGSLQMGTFTKPLWMDQNEISLEATTTDAPTTTTTTQAPPRDTRDLDAAAIEMHLSRNFSARVSELEMKLQAQVKAVEEKARAQIEEVTRRTDSEIRRLAKRVKFMTARVHRYGDHEYALMEEPQSWYTAEETCQAWGGHLASIADAEENEFIRGLHDGNAWIGLNDVQLENVHQYTDHKTFTYRNWRNGEPDNYQHNENCVLMEKDGKWADMLCIVTRPSLCKR